MKISLILSYNLSKYANLIYGLPILISRTISRSAAKVTFLLVYKHYDGVSSLLEVCLYNEKSVI